jgi:hypothetical protein
MRLPLLSSIVRVNVNLMSLSKIQVAVVGQEKAATNREGPPKPAHGAIQNTEAVECDAH